MHLSSSSDSEDPSSAPLAARRRAASQLVLALECLVRAALESGSAPTRIVKTPLTRATVAPAFASEGETSRLASAKDDASTVVKPKKAVSPVFADCNLPAADRR